MPPVVTQAQRQRERAVFLSFFLDVLMTVPLYWVGIAAGSVTMVGEATRGVLLIVVGIASLRTMRRLHRGQTGGYDYGLGKIEQILALCVAILLVATCLGVAYRAAVSTPGGDAGHLVASLAVVMAIANLAANSAPLIPLMRAARGPFSPIIRTQLRAKTAKATGSVIIVGTIAIHQFARDPVLALWADRVGSAIVILVTLHAAVDLLRAAVPDLLDRTLAEADQRRINQVLAEAFDGYETLEWCRSRRAGAGVEIDIGLGFAAWRTFPEIDATARSIERALTAEIDGARATVTPRLTQSQTAEGAAAA